MLPSDCSFSSSRLVGRSVAATVSEWLSDQSARHSSSTRKGAVPGAWRRRQTRGSKPIQTSAESSDGSA